MLNLSRVLAVIVKELRQLSRDRVTFAMIVMIPLIQLLLFGYAINTDVRHVPTGIVDFSQTTNARLLVQDLQASQAIRVVRQFAALQHAEQAVTSGEVNVILYIPPDFERRLANWRKGERSKPIAQWLTDASDPMLSNTIHGLQQLPLDNTQMLGGSTAISPMISVVHYFNPERRSTINIVPGLVAVILTMTMVLFTSAAIVREREQGNMEFLINTPIKPIELMLGKIVPYLMIGLIQTLLILGLGHGIFDVPLPAHWPSLFVVTLMFILASLTLGLLISTRATTQLQAMQMTVFILLPSILLSGFMFPFVAMPEPAQWLAEVLPATHYVRMIRAVVLRQAHWSDLPEDLIALAIFTLVGLLIATLRFKKRLD
ncbi:ABC transporter permease [Alteromonas facilis]|uniref:ABC transporter permease n=1 Tax=Alteromonas facilis TaxID=2048004 RepID=UPI000C291883|nr:ABC transporter permease [Alteromonas facilis]